jgi:nucleoid-associated protein YgaU
MEIAGYEIPDQYILAGGGILLVGGFLLSRNKGETKEIAELRPAEGLTWQDVIGRSDEGKLIGPGGPIGETGPPGLPPITPTPTPEPEPEPTPTDEFISDPIDAFSNARNKRAKDGGRACANNRDCPDGKRCRNGRCVGEREENGNTNSNRPHMPREGDGGRDFTDPRLDDPKDRKRRNESGNKVDNGRSVDRRTRDNSTETPVQHNPRSGSIRHPDKDSKHDGNGGRVKTGDIAGNIDINVSGGRETKRGKNADASAKGGRVKTGNIGKGTTGTINATGGTASANASGGNNERERRDREEKDRRDREERDRVNAENARRNQGGGGGGKGKGRGGYGVAGINTNGYGRLDGRGGDAEGFVRTHISPGSTTGSFMASPQALTGRNDNLVIARGETLKGLAKRAYGSASFWPRIVTLNNRVILPEGEIPAGTKIRI